MSSSSKNQEAKASGGNSSSQNDTQKPYMLEEFLRIEPTVAERLHGLAKHEEGEKGNKGYVEKAKEAIRKFEDAWNNASR
ncbi:hypothetical protein F5Y04DRAFT_244175 [Hypomontagnella monticulosa]|nr:hypothetical protein F5Y04DRAFT_244175 [Hypomontagnella monticulosa]